MLDCPKTTIQRCYQMVVIQIDLLLSTDSVLAMISSFLWWHRTSTVLASRPLYLSGLKCTGTETSLLSCPYTSPLGYPCSSEVGVHVTCSSPEEDEGEYVLRWCGGGSWLQLWMSVVMSSILHSTVDCKSTTSQPRRSLPGTKCCTN